MVYLIGRQVVQGLGLSFIEGSRIEVFSEILNDLKKDHVVGTDEIGNFEKFLSFLGVDYKRVTGGPNAQFYDTVVDYEDDVEKLIGFDRFIGIMNIEHKDTSSQESPVDTDDDVEVREGEV